MAVYNTFAMARGYGNLGNDLDVVFGTFDLSTIVTEAAALATDSTNLTAESGSLTAAMTLGATITAGEITLIGSLATTAANIAVESGSITVASGGTLTGDIILFVNTGTGSRIMDVYQALKTLDQYFLSGAPIGNTNFPQG